MLTALNDLAALISNGTHRDWTQLKRADLTPMLLRRIAGSDDFSGHQQKKMLAAARGLARLAHEMDLISTDQKEKLFSVQVRTTQELPHDREMLPDHDLGALVKGCLDEKSPAGYRDAAMIAVGFQLGLRRIELQRLTLDALEAAGGYYRVTIFGKGRKKRLLDLAGKSGEILNQWLAVRGSEPGHVFNPVRKGGKIAVGDELSLQAMDKILRKRVTAIGLPAMGWHDLRRKFGSQLLQNGIDPFTVQKLLGHARVETTQTYDRRPLTDRMDAAASLETPF